MTKTADELKPNYAPLYAAAMYPKLALAVQSKGYALAIHGSMARDFDVIAIPWTPDAASPEEVIQAIEAVLAVNIIGPPSARPHGRTAYMLSVGFGNCSIDLSFMPRTEEGMAEATKEAR